MEQGSLIHVQRPAAEKKLLEVVRRHIKDEERLEERYGTSFRKVLLLQLLAEAGMEE